MVSHAWIGPAGMGKVETARMARLATRTGNMLPVRPRERLGKFAAQPPMSIQNRRASAAAEMVARQVDVLRPNLKSSDGVASTPAEL